MRHQPDPTDPPVPLQAVLRRQGLIAADERIRVSRTPPPVRRRTPPGFAVVEIAGRPVTVRTTPPPPLRRRRAPLDQTLDPEVSLQPLAPIVAPQSDRVPQDMLREPAVLAVLACAGLLVFAAGLMMLA